MRTYGQPSGQLNMYIFLISQNISADLKGPKQKYKLHYGRCTGLLFRAATQLHKMCWNRKCFKRFLLDILFHKYCFFFFCRKSLMGSNTLIIMFMMAFALLLNLIFARNSFELDTLTCTSHDFCHCIRNVLLCNKTNDNFLLPKNIALREEIVSISLQGERFSVEIPDTYYNHSWSAIKHFEVIGSRGILSLPLSFTQSLKNLTILRVRNSNLSFI